MASRGHNRATAGIYEALPSATSIRVLQLVSLGNPSTRLLQCRLRVLNLNNFRDPFLRESQRQQALTYDALSYVWGNPDDQVTIVCNSATVPIRKNLYAALVDVWRSHPEKSIWADALCINQRDLPEKSVQVASMHHIYAKAEKVLIWLGPACDRTGQVFAVLKTALRLGTYDLDEVLGHMKQNKLLGQNDTSCAVLTQTKKHPQRHCTLHTMKQEVDKLLYHTWFSRAWTFQEIVVAPKPYVICGAYWIPWRDFQRAVPRYWDVGRQQETNVSLLRLYDRSVRSSQSSTTLLQLLIATRFRDASDAGDKVFALLNIPGLRPRQTIEVDYRVSTEEVFARASSWCIQSDQNLESLRMAFWHLHGKTNCRDRGEFSSWVTNWEQEGHISKWLVARTAERRKVPSLLKEIAYEKVTVVPTSNPCHLKIRGAALATIDLSVKSNAMSCYVGDFQNPATRASLQDDQSTSIGTSEYRAFHAVRPDFLAATSCINPSPGYPVVKLVPSKRMNIEDSSRKHHRKGKIILNDVNHARVILARNNLIAALYGSPDLYILSDLGTRTSEGDVVYKLVAVTDRAFIKVFGTNCFPPFKAVEQFFVLA
jgi:hypothetical protein